MRIIKYQKQKQGKYLIELENGTEIETYEDLILKYDLLIKKRVTPDLLQSIQEENAIYELYFVALKYLKVRMRSTLQLREYLLKKGYSDDLICSTMERLKLQGYLNDEIYGRSLVHDSISFGVDGPLKIKKELHNLDITEGQIDQILSEYTEDIELSKIEKLVLKHIRSNHSKSGYSLKQKIYQHLLNLGYHSSLIEQKLSLVVQGDEGEKKIYQKEYQKLYRKLSRKYTGKELEYQIKQKMFQKGFHSGDVC